MEAMGVTGSAASRVLRFSSGMKTSLEDWRALLDAVQQIQSISDEAKV
jgi:cysteine sulfinate desulfinase/cysteine desulfurase-like protein